MATQVPPSKLPTPYEDRPEPPSADLEKPADYRKTFQVSFAAEDQEDANGTGQERG
jgi:hypothetical protein